jgi:UrcA family protein
MLGAASIRTSIHNGRVVMSGMNHKRGTSIGLALLCSAAVMASGAIARTTTESMNVRYVAADLNTPDGAEKLYQRIRRAARLVCHEPNVRELDEYRLYQQCFDRAVDDAVAKVNSRALTALHRSRTQQHGTAG